MNTQQSLSLIIITCTILLTACGSSDNDKQPTKEKPPSEMLKKMKAPIEKAKKLEALMLKRQKEMDERLKKHQGL